MTTVQIVAGALAADIASDGKRIGKRIGLLWTFYDIGISIKPAKIAAITGSWNEIMPHLSTYTR